MHDCVIIGGGCSGTLLACQLMRRSAGTCSVAIVESRSSLGTGVAFGTNCPEHLLNVCSGNMSGIAEEPQHFLNWARRYDPQIEPTDFLPRRSYGSYLESLLRAAALTGPLSVYQSEAIDVRPSDGKHEVLLASGAMLTAKTVVLASGYLGCNRPSFLSGAGDLARDAWAGGALLGLPVDASIALIGSGLTALDQVLTLERSGFRGKITMISRHGLLPHSQKSTQPLDIDWERESAETARALLKAVRREVRNAISTGLDWRSVIDSLRPHLQVLWENLSFAEQRRFIRHLRTHWDVHRHRCAPKVHETIQSQIDRGCLQTIAGRVKECTKDGDTVLVRFQERGTSSMRTQRFDRIINCAGFESSLSAVRHPLLQSLFHRQLAQFDQHRMGISVDPDGRVLGAHELYAIGPLRKGTLWETTAVPEIRVQAAQLAQQILLKVQKSAPVAATL